MDSKRDLVLYPTETIYGLGVDVFDHDGVQALFQLKGREAAKSVSWLVSSIADIERYAVLDDVAAKIAEQFLPGPLTLVLDARPEVVSRTISKERTIGFRISTDPYAQALIAEYETPLTCTSANVSGMSTCASVPEILSQLGDKSTHIKRIIDGGERSGVSSTVVRVHRGKADVLREGAVPAEAIYGILA